MKECAQCWTAQCCTFPWKKNGQPTVAAARAAAVSSYKAQKNSWWYPQYFFRIFFVRCLKKVSRDPIFGGLKKEKTQKFVCEYHMVRFWAVFSPLGCWKSRSLTHVDQKLPKKNKDLRPFFVGNNSSKSRSFTTCQKNFENILLAPKLRFSNARAFQNHRNNPTNRQTWSPTNPVSRVSTQEREPHQQRPEDMILNAPQISGLAWSTNDWWVNHDGGKAYLQHMCKWWIL